MQRLESRVFGNFDPWRLPESSATSSSEDHSPAHLPKNLSSPRNLLKTPKPLSLLAIYIFNTWHNHPHPFTTIELGHLPPIEALPSPMRAVALEGYLPDPYRGGLNGQARTPNVQKSATDP